ncbi:MAG TPA: carbon-nitrogen hydrolase family protein [Chloroflexia bacterium]|nr:carbon-nitrogen hydrolase family protein [Chloroflexia bacterium]
MNLESVVKLKIALAQMRCEKGDWQGNLDRVDEYMARASSEGCHVIVFPEMGLSGYCEPSKFPCAVQPLDSVWLGRFVDMTARHGIAASGGFIEANPAGKPFITQILAQDGRVTAIYRKMHVVDEEADLFSPGAEVAVFNLCLPHGDLPCGLAVCADSDRPDLFAEMAHKGARIVFHSSAPGLYTRRTDEGSWREGFEWYQSHLAERLPTWARDNRLYIAVATQTGATVDEDFPGGSFIFGPDGSCIAATDSHAEALLVHELEL